MAETVNRCFRNTTANDVTKVYEKTGSELACRDWVSESGHYPCCPQDSICLGYGLCYKFAPEKGSKGFYTAGCTDASYDDPACNNACSHRGTQAAVYDVGKKAWKCCGYRDGVIGCDDPSNAMFIAPDPSLLLRPVGPASSSVDLASGATIDPTVSATSTPASSSGISAAAAAGVTAAGLLGLVAIFAAVLFVLRRRWFMSPKDIYNGNRWYEFKTSSEASSKFDVSAKSKMASEAMSLPVTVRTAVHELSEG